jgi:hypothetical protein
MGRTPRLPGLQPGRQAAALLHGERKPPWHEKFTDKVAEVDTNYNQAIFT